MCTFNPREEHMRIRDLRSSTIWNCGRGQYQTCLMTTFRCSATELRFCCRMSARSHSSELTEMQVHNSWGNPCSLCLCHLHVPPSSRTVSMECVLDGCCIVQNVWAYPLARRKRWNDAWPSRLLAGCRSALPREASNLRQVQSSSCTSMMP